MAKTPPKPRMKGRYKGRKEQRAKQRRERAEQAANKRSKMSTQDKLKIAQSRIKSPLGKSKGWQGTREIKHLISQLKEAAPA